MKQPTPPGQPILSAEPAYVGQPIVAIAAETEQAAEDAIAAVEVDLEPMPYCVDPLGEPEARRGRTRFPPVISQAAASTTARPNGPARTLRSPATISCRRASPWSSGASAMSNKAFDEAAIVVEETILHASNAHHAMEPRTAAAFWENGKCHVWGSTQSTAFAQPALSKLIGIEPSELVFVAEFCGGGFGGKATSYPLMALPALMSKKMGGRPALCFG